MQGKQQEQATTLRGLVNSVLFRSEDNGYSVISIEAVGHPDTVIVTGNALSVEEGDHLDCQGRWTQHPKHGIQFKADVIEHTHPVDPLAIVHYLSSSRFPGIGEKTARKFVDVFGRDIFDVLNEQPEALLSAKGITKRQGNALIKAWKKLSGDDHALREINLHLQSAGLSENKSRKVLLRFGESVVDQLREDPYLITDIHGIGFETADHFALKLGVARDALPRAKAGVRHILEIMTNRGDCAIACEELISECAKRLEVVEGLVSDAIVAETEAGRLILEKIDDVLHVLPAAIQRSEVSIANHLRRIQSGNLPWQLTNADSLIERVSENNGIKLADNQFEAVRTALSNKVSVITGGPGTGKTTIVKTLLDVVDQIVGRESILLAAPTGRAAKRMEESTGREGSTIHRLLEFGPQGFRRDSVNPLNCDLLVIDEASMIDVYLAASLLKAVPSHAVVIIVGDRDQLPSVGPGRILSDLIDSGVISTVKLNQIFRQAQGSDIIVNAHRVNEGQIPLSPEKGNRDSDFYFMDEPRRGDEESRDICGRILDKVLAMVKTHLPERRQLDPVDDIQVLAPMVEGILGVKNLNRALQAVLNPVDEGKPEIERFETLFRLGDKVMQTKNDYEKGDGGVFNGDGGRIVSVNPAQKRLVVKFDNGQEVDYNYDDLANLTLAYAITIHKSQGSEYPAVIIPFVMAHYSLLERQLLYTGMTRGRQMVLLIGESKAVRMAVNTNRGLKRTTNLINRLQGKA